MKRFITYLYDYKNGQKGKNTGFIRVDIRGKEVRLEIHICNAGAHRNMGTAYLLMKSKEILGLCIGEIMLKNGVADERYIFSYSNIQGSGFDFSDIIGVAIRFDDGYFASGWKDEKCLALEVGEFVIRSSSCQEDVDVNISAENACEKGVEVECPCDICQVDDEMPKNDIIYEKIELADIRDLPPKHRHLCSNSFLIHGFFNYQYLIRKREIIAGEETISVGVPGVFEQPEKMIAGMFGFLEFEPLCEQGEILERKEINQEQKEGTFGAWFIKLLM